jgi:hypothetical protein
MFPKGLIERVDDCLFGAPDIRYQDSLGAMPGGLPGVLGNLIDRRTNDDKTGSGDSGLQIGGRLRHRPSPFRGLQRRGSTPDSNDVPSQLPLAQRQSDGAPNQANAYNRHGVPIFHGRQSASGSALQAERGL